MILRTEVVEQAIDIGKRGTFRKDVIMTDGSEPLGMVRKRSATIQDSRAAVLLIHGFGQNRYTWHTSKRSFSNYLADAGFDVFNSDLRGHGRSRRFGVPRPRLMDEYIKRDVPMFAEEVKRISGHKDLFLIGHSMGGLISYCAGATSLREEVRGIVSIGSPYRFGLGSIFLDSMSRIGNMLRVLGVFDSNPNVPLELVSSVLRDRLKVWDSKLFPAPLRAWVPGSMEGDVIEEYLTRAFDQASISTMLAILRAGREGALKSEDGIIDYSAAFEHFDAPLLCIAGTKDRIVPAPSVKPAYDRSESHDKTYRAFPLGHVDLIMGRDAPGTVWPLILNWLIQRSVTKSA